MPTLLKIKKVTIVSGQEIKIETHTTPGHENYETQALMLSLKEVEIKYLRMPPPGHTIDRKSLNFTVEGKIQVSAILTQMAGYTGVKYIKDKG